MLPLTAASPGATARRRHPGRRAASFSVVAVLLSAYAVLHLLDGRDDDAYDDSDLSSSSRRLLQGPASGELLPAGELPDDPRLLAKMGASPPSSEEIAGQYVIKPWVGTAFADVLENKLDAKVTLQSAQASSERGVDYVPRYAIDDPSLATRWASDPDSDEDYEWINIDMGGPNTVGEVYVKWFDAYAADYEVFVSMARPNCRSDGGPCPDAWHKVVEVTGKSDASPSSDVIHYDDDDHSLQGVRYVRIKFNRKAPGYDHYSVYYVRVYRRRMIAGEVPSGGSCPGTTAAAANTLLGTYGGTLIQKFDEAEYFAADMTDAQADAMRGDGCVYAVEPNYVVRARGGTTGTTKAEAATGRSAGEGPAAPARRRLAIPEFNLRDEDPINWGLERISSHGKRNGKYTWFHEGEGVELYFFDTGIYPDANTFLGRDWTASRIGDGVVCAGTADDHEDTYHGTHVASVAAGFEHGTAKSAGIHPIQVLDANGEGTTLTFLCGLEKAIADAKAYNAAHAPEKIKGVVNLSLGVGGRSDILDKAVQDMILVGYTVVIAAGDHDGSACFYSPYDPGAITVGALRDDIQGLNEKTATSNWGDCVDVWAPGESVVGASNTGEFDDVEMSGTSVAAGFTAGAAALFLEEVFTEDYATGPEMAARVKEKLVNKAEIGSLVSATIRHGSPNRVLQTTVSKCSLNSHCQTGLTCLIDGTCRDMTKPLRSKIIS